jgi:3-phosphoshikimate 1-carboxyvinyltransferase
MAMSFAVAGLRLPGVVIGDPDCTQKTFPGFFEILERLNSENEYRERNAKQCL